MPKSPTILGILSGSHPIVDLWENGTLRSEVTAILDGNEVKFTLLGLFRVAGLCRIDGAHPATIVVAVLSGSLSLASARNVLSQVCDLLQQ